MDFIRLIFYLMLFRLEMVELANLTGLFIMSFIKTALIASLIWNSVSDAVVQYDDYEYYHAGKFGRS